MTGRIVSIVAAMSLLLGAAMTSCSVRRTGDVAARLRSKVRNLEELRALDAELSRYVAAQQTFQQTSGPHPFPLATLMKDLLPGSKTDEVRESQRASVAGWVVQERSITFSETPMARIFEFVSRTEQLRPPWLMARCVLTASSRAPGVGQIELTLEALDHQQPDAGANPK